MPKYFGLSPASSSWCLPSNEDDDFSFQTIFPRTCITGNSIPIYRSDYLPTNSFPWVTEKISKRRRSPLTLRQVHAMFKVPLSSRDWAQWLLADPTTAYLAFCNCWSLTTGAEGQVRLCGFTHLAGDLFEHRCRNIVYEWCSKLMPRTEEQFVYNLTSCTLLPICA